MATNGVAERQLTRPELFLDGPTLDRHLHRLHTRIGCIPSHSGSRFSQAVAHRLSWAIGRRYAHRLALPAELLADAWYFSLWTELCTLVPVRHLARHLARIAAGAPVLIPVHPDNGHYLSYWTYSGSSGLEPLYLAAALRQLRVPAALVFADHEKARAAERDGHFTLRLLPDPIWDCSPIAESGEVRGNRILIVSGMRDVPDMLSRLDNPLLVRCGFSALPSGFDTAILGPNAALPPVELQFERRTGRSLLPAAAMHFSARLPHSHLGEWLCQVLGPTTQEAARRAEHLVERHSLKEAHICDHMFFESAIVAHAVRSRGGQVVVWPHSSNAVHVRARRPNHVDQVHCATTSAARIWTARFPALACDVVSDLMLTPCSTPRALSPNQPITVVVIAGSHRQSRLPLLDAGEHANSYRSLFTGLASMAPGVRFLCKAKQPWETMEWLRSLVEPGVTLVETTESPKNIDIPNLIYVTVSFGSTAILEALGRGIPSMVVREIPMEDYTGINPACFPVGSVETILRELRLCQDSAHFLEMVETQLKWYSNETCFEPTTQTLARQPEAA